MSANGKYGSASDLRKAAVELGYKCPKWRDTPEAGLAPAIGLAESSGTCDGKDQFLVYGPGRGFGSDWYTVKDQLDDWGSTMPGTHMLLGPNWILTMEKDSDDYKSLAKRLGGEVHH